MKIVKDIFKKMPILANLLTKMGVFSIVIIIILCMSSCSREGCIDSEDLGDGSIYISAKPNDEKFKFILLRDKPSNSQVAPWIYSGFQATGFKENDDGSIKSIPMRLKIKGGWNPWGSNDAGEEVICPLVNCSNTSGSLMCLIKGLNISGVLDNKMKDYGQIIPMDDNRPCSFNKGRGLYGLIVVNGTIDPNANYGDVSSGPAANASANPHMIYPNEVRTFHIADYMGDTGDSAIITGTTKCSYENDKYVCMKDEVIPNGPLYFKIQDSYYNDNSGGYKIIALDGMYSLNNVIKNLIEGIQTPLQNASDTMYKIISNSGIINVIRILMVLYICFLGMGFMLGTIKMHQSELIIQLFKLGVVVTLVSTVDHGAEFFNTFFINFATNFGNEISNVIMNALSDINKGSPITFNNSHISGGLAYMGMYDILVKRITSAVIHKKIWSLLFTDRCYYIPLLYMFIWVLLITIFKALMIYIVAIFQITLLAISAPIFVPMMLFKTTMDGFKRWYQYLGSSAMLVIVTTATMMLMFKMIDDSFRDLFRYGVCWWDPVFGGGDSNPVRWFIPNSDYTGAMSFGRYMELMFKVSLFHMFLEHVARLSDSLGAIAAVSSQNVSGTSSAASNVIGGAASGAFKTAVDTYNFALDAPSNLNAVRKYISGARIGLTHRNLGEWTGDSKLGKITKGGVDSVIKKLEGMEKALESSKAGKAVKYIGKAAIFIAIKPAIAVLKSSKIKTLIEKDKDGNVTGHTAQRTWLRGVLYGKNINQSRGVKSNVSWVTQRKLDMAEALEAMNLTWAAKKLKKNAERAKKKELIKYGGKEKREVIKNHGEKHKMFFNALDFLTGSEEGLSYFEKFDRYMMSAGEDAMIVGVLWERTQAEKKKWQEDNQTINKDEWYNKGLGKDTLNKNKIWFNKLKKEKKIEEKDILQAKKEGRMRYAGIVPERDLKYLTKTAKKDLLDGEVFKQNPDMKPGLKKYYENLIQKVKEKDAVEAIEKAEKAEKEKADGG